jgi:hypothetical protein
MIAVISRQKMVSNPLLLPEIVASVINYVDSVPDLLNCACVNYIWNVAALKKLYKGSLNDMQFRTPDTGSLNCLLVASRERFAQNMSYVKHLLLAPGINAEAICHEKCKALRRRKDADILLRPQGRGLASLAIPFRINGQDWPDNICDLLRTSTIEYLAIDWDYCDLWVSSAIEEEQLSFDKCYRGSPRLNTPTVSFVWPVLLPLHKKPCLTPAG